MFKNELIIQQKASKSEKFGYLSAILLPIATLVISVYTIQVFGSYGSKLLAPMIALMWASGVVFAIIMPSHREDLLGSTEKFIFIYTTTLLVLRIIIRLLANTSMEEMMSSLEVNASNIQNTNISATAQTVMSITAVMMPLGKVGYDIQRFTQFKRKSSAKKTLRKERGIFYDNGNLNK